MRPDYPSGKVVDLEGEELEELIEGERPAPFAETEELDLARMSGSGRVPSQPAARVNTPQSELKTGPGRSQRSPSPSDPGTSRPRAPQPDGGPLLPVRTEPMQDVEVVSSPSTPARDDRTASLRKAKSAVAASPAPTPSRARSQARARSRSRVRAKTESNIDELLGQTLGSYRVLSLIGEGGMGRVYHAEHVLLGRKVALKLLRPEYAVKRDAVSRFFKEAQSVNKIGHENIVDITDFVELESGETFIIMELLQGDDLADIQRKGDGPMPLHRAMQIALQVCDALEAAHKVDIVHRDLKPDNIFIVNTATKRDFVKLLDFGVAKLLGEPTDSDGWHTAAGSVIGTPAYMSPEQASGIPVDARSDIYSLGAILYELFTGHPVFRAKSFGEYVVKHMNDEPIPPRDLANAPKIPSSLERVILRCLEKDPNKRYQSVNELREDLARATATVQTAISLVPTSAAAKPRRRRTWIAIPIVAAVVGLAVAAFWLASGLSLDDVAPGTRDPAPKPVRKDPQPGASSEPLGVANRVQTAKLRLETDPKGADVYRRDDPRTSLGKTPLDLHLDNVGKEVEFLFRLAGYEDAVERVTVTDNAVYSVPLERQRSLSSSGGGAVRPPAKVRVKTKVQVRTKVEVVEPKSKKDEPTPAPKAKTKKPTKINPEDVVDPFAQ
jgi:serine/threonine-protein kinase